jgi:L-lactate dehydrogenase complex protein LldG
MALGSTVDEAPSVMAAPAAIRHYLDANELPRMGVCWPELAALDWNEAGIHLEARPAEDKDLIGITSAFCAIAETGTLMLLSGATTAPTTSLLPETHIAIVNVARIVRGMEEAWDLLRSERAKLPRAVNFISGPSRTADIEQTIVIGAHGPYRVHIVVVK